MPIAFVVFHSCTPLKPTFSRLLADTRHLAHIALRRRHAKKSVRQVCWSIRRTGFRSTRWTARRKGSVPFSMSLFPLQLPTDLTCCLCATALLPESESIREVVHRSEDDLLLREQAPPLSESMSVRCDRLTSSPFLSGAGWRVSFTLCADPLSSCLPIPFLPSAEAFTFYVTTEAKDSKSDLVVGFFSKVRHFV